MRSSRRKLAPPLDFRFLDLFFIVLVSGAAVFLVFDFGTPAPLHIQTSMLATAYAGTPYKQELCGFGGATPYRWTAKGLPPGILLTSEGLIRGVPAEPGRFAVQVGLTDAGGHKTITPLALDVKSASPTFPLGIVTVKLPPAVLRSAYDVTLAAEGGAAPYRWLSNKLPAGLSLIGGRIVGTPTEIQSSTISLSVSDANDSRAARTLTLDVLPGLGNGREALMPLQISDVLPPALAGMPYRIQLDAQGGMPPYKWTLLRRVSGTQVKPGGLLESSDPALWPADVHLQVAVIDALSNAVVKDLSPSVVRPKPTLMRAIYAASSMAAWIGLTLVCLSVLSSRQFRLSTRSIPVNVVASLGFATVAAGLAFNPAFGTVMFLGIAIFLVGWLLFDNA